MADLVIKMFYFKKYALSIVLSTTILVLCMISPTDLPDAPTTNFDKWVHFLMFLGLSGIVFFENTAYLKRPISLQRLLFGSFLFPILFSGAIELIQEYASLYRVGDWYDFLFDVIGSFCGLLICWVINRRLISLAQ
jgi:VanZ family protein